jgi:hypothetical protein
MYRMQEDGKDRKTKARLLYRYANGIRHVWKSPFSPVAKSVYSYTLIILYKVVGRVSWRLRLRRVGDVLPYGLCYHCASKTWDRHVDDI